MSRLLNFGLDPLGKSGDVSVYTIVPPSATPAPASSAHEVPAVVALFTHQRTCQVISRIKKMILKLGKGQGYFVLFSWSIGAHVLRFLYNAIGGGRSCF